MVARLQAWITLVGLVMVLVCVTYQAAKASTVRQSNASNTDSVEVQVTQAPGKIVFWILPGKRRLGEAEWGTPDRPKALLAPVMADAKLLPAPLNRTVPQLLHKVPILGGLPLEARATTADGTRFTTTKRPTAVSDHGRTVAGSFAITYHDRTPWDLPGVLTDTLDTVDATAQFTDPAGNHYKLVVEKLWQPPIPGWETGGGVVTNTWIHGTSGTESPLFPRVFTWGAFWGLGKVIVNGQVVNENQWIHFMTTQVVRDKQYLLVTQDELPLTPTEAFAGQPHHTHVIVRPVRLTPDGPVFEPVHTAFTLPNGKPQPFLHLMFEQDTIVQGVFRAWPAPMAPKQAQPAMPGAALAQQYGCVACHSSDGSPRLGPTWKGLFGKQETLADGSTVRVDAAYLQESIVAPNAKVVKGFPAGVMLQDFRQRLSEADIAALIAYIKSLQ
jgi:cytochrome c2